MDPACRFADLPILWLQRTRVVFRLRARVVLHRLPETASRARLVGEATLRAVEEVAEPRISLQLEAVATTELGETQIAMAQVLMDGVPVPLVGSALLTEHDATAATVRAVLDALNRRLEQVL